MKKITAKFNSKCAETGKRIYRGDTMYYDYSAKKCYCLTSNKAIAQEQTDQESYNPDAWITDALVDAYENQYR